MTECSRSYLRQGAKRFQSGRLQGFDNAKPQFMKRYRNLLANTTLLLVGLFLGVAASRYFFLLEEFPSVMALRLFMPETLRAVPAKAGLSLLDIYEDRARRQAGWLGSTRFNWNQELINIALQRYVLCTAAGQTDLANTALRDAVTLRGKKNPSPDDIEFEKQLAIRLFGSNKPNQAP